MAQRLPLVLNAGQIQQLQTGDTIFGSKSLQNLSGNVVQQSGTTILAYNNTAPKNSGSNIGTQVWSQTITPTVIGSEIEIDFSSIIDTSATNLIVVMALFNNNVLLNAVASSSSAYNGNVAADLTIKGLITTTSLSPLTISCNVGISAAGTWYLGRGSAATFGGTTQSIFTIKEVLP